MRGAGRGERGREEGIEGDEVDRVVALQQHAGGGGAAVNSATTVHPPVSPSASACVLCAVCARLQGGGVPACSAEGGRGQVAAHRWLHGGDRSHVGQVRAGEEEEPGATQVMLCSAI